MINSKFKKGFVMIWGFIIPFVILSLLISISFYRLNNQMDILHRKSSLSIMKNYAYGCAVFIIRRISVGDIKKELEVGNVLINTIEFKDNLKCNYFFSQSRNGNEINAQIEIEYANIIKHYKATFLKDKFSIKILSFLEE